MSSLALNPCALELEPKPDLKKQFSLVPVFMLLWNWTSNLVPEGVCSHLVLEPVNLGLVASGLRTGTQFQLGSWEVESESSVLTRQSGYLPNSDTNHQRNYIQSHRNQKGHQLANWTNKTNILSYHESLATISRCRVVRGTKKESKLIRDFTGKKKAHQISVKASRAAAATHRTKKEDIRSTGAVVTAMLNSSKLQLPATVQNLEILEI